jgi:hypothetical protein
MCDCITKLNAELKPQGQCVDATMFGVGKATTMLIRTDKWIAENRRSKPSRIIASFCPFCGEKYAESAQSDLAVSSHDGGAP